MKTNKRVVLSSDHAAIKMRMKVAKHVVSLGWEAIDIGPTTSESTHYPHHGAAAAELVKSGDCRFGIILCGTGQGIMMAANKIKGVRCGVGSDLFSAEMIRAHNDANMLSLGSRVINETEALQFTEVFLNTPFEGGRHGTRVEMIDALEA